MKTVLFAPGGMEVIHSRDYESVLDAIRHKGYEVVFVPITWKRTAFSDWVSELLVVYEKYDPKNTILAGFSWGSMAAFVAAAERPPCALWLFSFSPFFSDDKLVLDARKNTIPKYMGKHRLEAFEQLNFSSLAAKIMSPTLIFMGEYEAAELKDRCTVAARKIPQARLITVPHTRHTIDNPAYIAAIEQNI